MAAQPKARRQALSALPISEQKPVRTFGDVAPVLVHDFKGPLSAIALNLDFVLEHLPPDTSFDVIRGALIECRQAEERIFRVIANLLDVARCEEGRLSLRITPADLAEIVGTVVEDHAEEITTRAIAFRVEISEDLPAFETDIDLLARVLHNVVDNALRSAKNGGTVVVRGFAPVGREHQELEIHVANDGPPIPLAIQEGLFQRNVGSEYNGSGANRGIGLYFCRLALAELGASISLTADGAYPVCFAICHPLRVGELATFTASDSEFPDSAAIPIVD